MIDLDKINTLIENASKASEVNSYAKTPLRVSLLDPITRVYSKDFFDVQYEIHWHMSLRQNTSISLFVVKVNELASLNLANGQNSGDYALQKLAKCLSLLFRRATDLIFRTDDDQFMILTTEMDKTQTDFYVEQIKLRIKNLKIMNKKTERPLTVNVGCAAAIPNAKMKPDVIIKDALKRLDK
jgi:two-component system, cell cycle response regulator